MSTTFTLTGTNSVLSHKLYPPIVLDDESEYVLGLINFGTCNSFANVDDTNNKFYFTLQNGKKSHITIPEGSYEIDDISRYLSEELARFVERENKKTKQTATLPFLFLKGNNNTLKSEIKCTLDIDFTKKDSIGNLLGFKPKRLTSHTRHISDFPCKISKINGLCVECNIVAGAYKNGEQVHVIHEFFPSVPSGYNSILLYK
jgi:hypothetical protein